MGVYRAQALGLLTWHDDPHKRLSLPLVAAREAQLTDLQKGQSDNPALSQRGELLGIRKKDIEKRKMSRIITKVAAGHDIKPHLLGLSKKRKRGRKNLRKSACVKPAKINEKCDWKFWRKTPLWEENYGGARRVEKMSWVWWRVDAGIAEKIFAPARKIFGGYISGHFAPKVTLLFFSN